MNESSFSQPELVEKKDSEKSMATLKLATITDADILFTLNQKMKGLHTYSAMDDLEEQRSELENSIVYLIEKDGKVVGYISYEMKSEQHAYLGALVIDPEYQGQGFGREALTHVLQELKNTERIDLTVHPENKTALQLYLSLGFQIESRKENHYGDGEPRLVLVKMKRHENR